NTINSMFTSVAPWAYNMVFKNAPLRRLANRMVGFHPDRTMPLLSRYTLKSWFKKQPAANSGGPRVYFFCDEFTNYNDVEIGKKAIVALQKLGYEVLIPEHAPSGRPQLSKGLLREARKLAERNVTLLKDLITRETPLVGIEPS